MGDAHPTGLLNKMTTKTQQPLSILESRHGVDEASHPSTSQNPLNLPKRGNKMNMAERTTGFRKNCGKNNP
jgi:hypothetical protein